VLYNLRTGNSIAGRPQPIKARLIGGYTCHVDSLTTNAEQPIFEMCRLLLRHGYSAERPLLVFRGKTLAITVRTIREGAGLAVNGKGSAFYRLRKVCIASPARKSARAYTPGTPGPNYAISIGGVQP
jgi:hypothetical protein